MTTPELGRPTLPDRPAFEHWGPTDLNNWAHGAYDMLQEQARTIEQQRLELRKHVDDWK
jgi:hypothetical protein